jgi:hypothetical protein
LFIVFGDFALKHHEKDNGLLSFWFAFFLIMIFVFSVFLVLYVLVSSDFNMFDPNKGAILSDSLSLVLGIPVAFAGSIVAIMLSQRALSVSKRQYYIENLTKIDESVDGVYHSYLACYSALHRLSSAVMNYVSEYKLAQSRLDEDCSRLEELENTVKECRGRFIESLNEMQRVPVFMSSWARFIENKDPVLSGLLNYLSCEDESPNGKEIPNLEKSLPDYIFFLEAAGAGVNVKEVVKDYYHLISNSVAEWHNGCPVFPSDGIECGPEDETLTELIQPVDVFLLSGLLLGSQDEYVEKQEKNDNGPFQDADAGFERIGLGRFNYGAGFLLDFYLAHPSPEFIFECMSESLRDIVSDDPDVLSYLKERVFGKNFNYLRVEAWDTPVRFLEKNRDQLIDSKHLYFGERANQITGYLTGDPDWS